MNLSRIPTFVNQHIHVVIETPKGSRFKYAYEENVDLLVVRHELPEGFTFPINFGFIPHTLAGDGDPLDVLVMSETPAISGCLMECRVVGAVTARQRDRNKWVRNDRVWAVPVASRSYENIQSLSDISKTFLTQVEQFFVAYNAARGKTYQSLKRLSPVQALALIRKSQVPLPPHT
ncbi:inorganic diphosphatase [Chryseolinea soli]|uniref:inorganic diphosphatase n=1 Tax=Chryseolinea soli TaxID=2321403 RepID=A0A385SI31_9BACT|nr:inorganic diphosphatase [Chryseolinea soli]AYB29575.1 inorganic diphosphatase [Chryseolinea soli]